MSNLPRLLHVPDYAKRAESELALTDEANNDELALKLGRAFLRGRIDQFLNLAVHFEVGSPPPLPTQEECDMYAAGYQYSFDANMHDELAGDDDDPDQIERAAQIARRLSEIVIEIDTNGVTLELVNERVELRGELTNMTLANILNKLHASDPLEVAMRKATALFFHRRPLATGKVDGSDET